MSMQSYASPRLVKLQGPHYNERLSDPGLGWHQIENFTIALRVGG